MNNIRNIFKNALHHEVRSSAFYEKAAEMTENDEVRMLFLELSLLDDTHADEIVKKALSLSDNRKIDLNDYRSNLENATKNNFSKHTLYPFPSYSLKKVLEISTEMEKKASHHYMELLYNEPNEYVKKLYRNFADQKIKHFNSISRMLTSLDMEEWDRPAL